MEWCSCTIGFLPKIEESSSEQIDPENFVALDVGSPFDFATQRSLIFIRSLFLLYLKS